MDICPFRDMGDRTFRRNGLHFSAEGGGEEDAREGEFCDERTHALCDPAQGRGGDGVAVPRVRHLAHGGDHHVLDFELRDRVCLVRRAASSLTPYRE